MSSTQSPSSSQLAFSSLFLLQFLRVCRLCPKVILLVLAASRPQSRPFPVLCLHILLLLYLPPKSLSDPTQRNTAVAQKTGTRTLPHSSHLNAASLFFYLSPPLHSNDCPPPPPFGCPKNAPLPNSFLPLPLARPPSLLTAARPHRSQRFLPYMFFMKGKKWEGKNGGLAKSQCLMAWLWPPMLLSLPIFIFARYPFSFLPLNFPRFFATSIMMDEWEMRIDIESRAKRMAKSRIWNSFPMRN